MHAHVAGDNVRSPSYVDLDFRETSKANEMTKETGPARKPWNEILRYIRGDIFEFKQSDNS